MVMNGVTKSEFNSTDFVISSAVGGVFGALGQAGAATTWAGAIALEGGAGVIQYGATELANGRYPTLEGVAWSGAWGMVGGVISGPSTSIDNITRTGPSQLGWDLENPKFRRNWQSAIWNETVAHSERSAMVTLITNLPRPR